jgi:hypothetical protein
MTRWPPTQLIIFSSASLHREAWRALLSSQHDILISDAVADASEVAPHLQSDQSTTILVDVLSLVVMMFMGLLWLIPLTFVGLLIAYLLGWCPEGRILEVGVGTGRNILFYPEGIQLTAIDLRVSQIENLKGELVKLIHVLP